MLLITFDTTRADYLGCYGRSDARTPYIDRLAGEGVLLKHCSTCTSMTLPSHSSIMTGDYPFVHGVRRNATDKLSEAYPVLAESFKDANYTTGAVLAAIVLNKQFGLAQGFDSYLDMSPRPGNDGHRVYRGGDEVCDEAIPLLDNSTDQPFFLWVHFYDPHYPYEPRTRPTNSPEEAYADEITFMDMQVGRLLAELERLGKDDNTLVVMVGDHGEGLGQHGEWQHGFFVYETTFARAAGVLVAGRTERRGCCRRAGAHDRRRADHPRTGRPAAVARHPGPKSRHLAGRKEPAREAAGLRRIVGGAQPAESRTAAQHHPGRVEIHAGASAGPLQPRIRHPTEQVNLINEQPEIADGLYDELRQLIADAPTPMEGDDTFVELTAQEVERLESLGYVASVANPRRIDQ